MFHKKQIISLGKPNLFYKNQNTSLGKPIKTKEKTKNALTEPKTPQRQKNATECQFRHSQSKSMDPNICKASDFIERSEEALEIHVK